MTAQATAMPRQHPKRFSTVSSDRRLRRRPLATAAIALAAPVFAVTTLAAVGAVTDSGGAGLGSLPGADGLKGASGTAVEPQPLDQDSWDKPKGYGDREKYRAAATRERTPSGSTDPSGGRDTTVQRPPRRTVPDFGGQSPPVTNQSLDVSQPGYPGGITTGSGSTDDSGSGSGSGGTSGTSGSGGGYSGE
jgi:hypothetical protein